MCVCVGERARERKIERYRGTFVLNIIVLRDRERVREKEKKMKELYAMQER